jgi:hypothetical protein
MEGRTDKVQVFPKSSHLTAWGHSGSRRSLLFVLACAFSLTAASGFADEQKKKPKHRNTPLDTILQTRLWTDTPEPKGFVRDHRPPADRLEYQPLTGTDPERPKLRTPEELKALETELEAARVHADKRAGIKPKPPAASSTKPKPATATQ